MIHKQQYISRNLRVEYKSMRKLQIVRQQRYHSISRMKISAGGNNKAKGSHIGNPCMHDSVVFAR